MLVTYCVTLGVSPVMLGNLLNAPCRASQEIAIMQTLLWCRVTIFCNYAHSIVHQSHVLCLRTHYGASEPSPFIQQEGVHRPGWERPAGIWQAASMHARDPKTTRPSPCRQQVRACNPGYRCAAAGADRQQLCMQAPWQQEEVQTTRNAHWPLCCLHALD